MESRIKELEASISALKSDLEQVKDKEENAKSSTEEVTDEISQFKEEVQGTNQMGWEDKSRSSHALYSCYFSLVLVPQLINFNFIKRFAHRIEFFLISFISAVGVDPMSMPCTSYIMLVCWSLI